MFATLTALAALLSAPAPAQEADDAPPAPEEAAALDEETFEVRFDEHLMLDSDITLQGLMAYETVTFTRPRGWELTGDLELELRFEHSPQLVSERSSLTVRVNEHALTSIPLTRENAVGGRARITIPRALLEDYNKVTLMVTQHVTDECEDPFDPSLWTRVNRESLVRFHYRDREIEDELLNYPFPIFDPLDYGPALLTLVSPSTEQSPAVIEAVSVLGLSLGRLVGYHTVKVLPPVSRLSEVKTHALVVGTPEENPIVERLVAQRGLAPGEGLVALLKNPNDPSLAMLVVTGRDREGLLKAAHALAGQDRYPVLSGAVSKVRFAESDAPPPSRRLPFPAPRDPTFTLADLRIPDQTVRGFYAPPVHIPLQLEGDSQPRLDDSWLQLHYGYSAQLDPRLSTMEVWMNGVVLHSVALDDPDGEQDATLEIELREGLLAPRNELEVIFHLFPLDFDPCRRVSDRMIWGTVFSSSQLTVRRDNYAMLPDLGLLQYDLWPFTLEPGVGDTTLFVSDAPDSYDAAVTMQISAELGRLSVWRAPSLEVVSAGEVSLSQRADRHAVLLVDGDDHAAWKSLVDKGAAAISGDAARLLRTPGAEELEQADVETPYGSIEELAHPDNPDRSLLVLRAQSASDLLSMAWSLQDLRQLLALEAPHDEPGYSAAVLGAAGQVRPMSVGEQRQVGEIPLVSRFEQTLRRSWWMIGLLVLLGAVGLAAIGRIWARARGGQA